MVSVADSPKIGAQKYNYAHNPSGSAYAEPPPFTQGRQVPNLYCALSFLLCSSRYSGDPSVGFADSVSLRLGHGAALTCHRHVIHYRAAASLPRRGAKGAGAPICGAVRDGGLAGRHGGRPLRDWFGASPPRHIRSSSSARRGARGCDYTSPRTAATPPQAASPTAYTA